MTDDGEAVTEPLEQLLARCRRGDEEAVAVLVERFGRRARSLATAILGDEHLAEDAVQEGFLAAIGKLGQLREAGAFPAWFRQIVRTQAHRILRRRRERVGGPAEAPAGNGPAPDQAAQADELRRIVRRAVAALPPPGGAAAELFYLDEYTVAETAELLNVPEGTVKRRLHDARTMLRSMLLGYVADEPPEEEPPQPPEWPLPL